MARFSSISKKNLKELNTDLQAVLLEAIKVTDFTILNGYRPPRIQFEMFKRGRQLKDGIWQIVDKSKVITNCDGYKIIGKHNKKPSEAVDIAPYPIDWNDIDRFKRLADIVLNTARQHGIELVWGGNWRTFKDYPHYELKK
jgi:peptidoglycan L-alanyl-D-glutamate endopeptidase CwlK